MRRATSRRVVAASIEHAFRAATSAERLPEWNPFFVEVHDVSGDLDRVGASFDAVMRIGGRQLETQHIVTSFERPRLIVIAATAPKGGRLIWSRRFEGVGSRRTEIETILDYTVPADLAPSETDRSRLQREIEGEVMRSVDNFCALVEGVAALVG